MTEQGTLTDKLAAAEQAQTSGQSPAKRNGTTIYDLVQRQQSQIAKAIPSHLDPERFTRIVLTQLRRTPKLAACEAPSLLGAVMALAQVGLEPDGRNAHLVPYGKQCTPIIDYRGLIELARRSGQIADVYAHEVYANDRFEYRLGLHRDIVHEPTDGPRGDLTHVYAVANFKDGGMAFVVLNRDEVLARRDRSKAKDSGPWKTDEAAMWRKSAVRALGPYLPYSPELVRAENLDAATDRGHRFTPDEVIDLDAGDHEEVDPEAEVD